MEAGTRKTAMETPAQAPARPARIAEALLVSLGAALVALYAARPLYAVDLFWHLKLGEVIADTGEIPTRDMFSAVHPESPWVQFQWLWELCAHAIVSAFGLTGLRVSQGLLMAATFATIYLVIRQKAGLAVAALATALWLVLFEDRFQVRPDAFNLVLFVPLLPLVLGRLEPGSDGVVGARTMVLFALLAFLWANIHSGGSLLLLATLGALATGATLNRWLGTGPAAGAGRPIGRLWALVALCLGLMLASPAFIKGLIHFTRIFGPAVAIGNPEWDPSYTMLSHGAHPNFLVAGLFPYLCAGVWAIHMALRAKRRGRAGLDLEEVLLLGGYLFLAHYWVRSAWLAVVPLVVLLRRVPPGGALRPALFGAAAVLLTVSFHYNVLRPRGTIARALEMTAVDLEPTAFPEQAADFMEAAGIEGPAMNEGKWGGYLIWRLWPAVRVFVDTRHNLDDRMWRLFVASHHPFERGAALDEAFRLWGIDLAVFRSPTFPLYVPEAPWVMIYKAGDQEVFARADTERGRANIELAAALLEERSGEALPREDDGLPAPGPLWALATRVGGRDWLTAPYQMMRWRDAEAALASGDADAALVAERSMAVMLFEAGLYAEAAERLDALATGESARPSILYACAFSFALSGQPARALPVLERMARSDLGSLSPAERQRARRLYEALSGGRQSPTQP